GEGVPVFHRLNRGFYPSAAVALFERPCGHSRNFRPSGGAIGPALGCPLAAFDVELIENGLDDRVRRAVVPCRIIVVIEPDGRDRSLADVGASPTAAAAQEFAADAEIRMFHRRAIARPGLSDRFSFASGLRSHCTLSSQRLTQSYIIEAHSSRHGRACPGHPRLPGGDGLKTGVARATARQDEARFLCRRHGERSEAIQCCDAGLDCFVASLLAMTRFVSSPAPPPPGTRTTRA